MLYSRPRLGSLTQDLKTSTFRKAAIGLATVTMMGASALASFPAAAQQLASSYGGSPACSKYVNDGPSLAQCEANQLDVRLKNAKARGAAADTRGAAADDELKCINVIMNDLENNGTKTASLNAVPPKGQACKTAKALKLISG
jgi:hypothetical protein